MISAKRCFGTLLILIMVVTSVKALSLGELQYSPEVIHPGDDVDLWIKVTNDNYDEDLKNIEISIKPHYPFELKQVNPIKGVATIHHLNPGESDVVHFKLHVNESAVSGNYRLDITVSYDKVEKEEGVVTHHNWTKVYYLPVYGTPNFEIVLENNSLSLIPGRTVTIPILIYNKGTGKAKECTLSIGSNQYISPVGGTKFYIGTVKPQEIKLINLKLHTDENTPEGAYLIPATLCWIGEDGTEKSEEINMGLTVHGDILLGISNVITTPRDIKPGDTYVRIDVTVTNNGHGEAKDVKLHLKTSYPFKDSWSNANYKDIGTLRGGESKTVSFTVDVDKYAPSKHYKIPIYIEYLDIFNRRHNTTKTIDIYVKSKPILEIIPKEYTIKAGKDNTLLITVKNVGNEKAESVRITAIRNSAQPFDYPRKSDTIGTLNPGENGTGAIVVSVDKNALPKEYFITIEIRAVGDRDEGDDNVYITQRSIRVKVENDNKMPFPLYAVIGILVIIGVLYYLGKNLGKKNSK
ncbi:COG1361 S-layer family protein [Methanofervidicoccus abyssi]|nr:COG1361 S-layer family protein [Methanofervidicoccus abyssi]